MDTQKIEHRYNGLAEESCCLSCGGAINYTDVREGYVCVDLGSGRGSDLLRMAEKAGPKGYAYGIDASTKMIEKASKTAKKLGVTNVEFIQSEFEKLPLDDNTADCLISNCSINHASDKQAVWNEVYRILKEEGYFIVSDIYSSAPVPEEYRNDPEAVAECWAGASTKEEYLSTLEKAGFEDITIFEESAPYPKGKIEVSSFTIAGRKKKKCCCCSN